MSASLLSIEEEAAKVSTVARTLARTRNFDGKGRSTQHCVRRSDTGQKLLEQAKPERQSMVEFLKEAALTVALQRLESCQK